MWSQQWGRLTDGVTSGLAINKRVEYTLRAVGGVIEIVVAIMRDKIRSVAGENLAQCAIESTRRETEGDISVAGIPGAGNIIWSLCWRHYYCLYRQRRGLVDCPSRWGGELRGPAVREARCISVIRA